MGGSYCRCAIPYAPYFLFRRSFRGRSFGARLTLGSLLGRTRRDGNIIQDETVRNIISIILVTFKLKLQSTLPPLPV